MTAFSVPIGSIGVKPSSIFSPFSHRTKTLNPSFRKAHLGFLPNHGLCRRGGVAVARFGLGQVPFFDPDGAEGMMIKDLFGRVEMFLYTVADAAVAGSPDAVLDSTTTAKQSDWLSGITNGMETVLKVLKGGLSTLHVPYSYGFAIILLTVLVKVATFPLTKKQVESAMSMRTLAPQIKAIQERYAGDQEKTQLETARLYKLAGINPLAGCLPTLATIPIWIGLYRALSNVADEGLLTEGFFWIPSLAGPTTIAAKQTGSGISWLFQFVDGQPPLGWNDTLAYLVLPVLLVVSQYISVQIMQQQQPQSNDPNMKTSQTITKFLPLLIGYFSLSVPSGLSLYWLTNNILSTAQQVYLQKLGGAKSLATQINDEIVKKELRKMPDILKSISEAPSHTKINTVEKPTPQGPRPGDRFKQLKEEEARKRRQREEEKRKAEEAEAQLEASEPSNNINHVEQPTNGAISSEVESCIKTANLNGSRGDEQTDQPQLDESVGKDEVTANIVGEDNKSPGKDENEE